MMAPPVALKAMLRIVQIFLSEKIRKLGIRPLDLISPRPAVISEEEAAAEIPGRKIRSAEKKYPGDAVRKAEFEPPGVAG